MAFTVIFPTTTGCPEPAELGRWLTDLGEAFDAADAAVELRALPVRFVFTAGGPLKAHLDITSTVPLTRVVNLLYAVSVEAGTDVRVAGHDQVTRASLWMLLADEQDRMRIASALSQASEQGQGDSLTRGLWELVAALRPGCDDRWDIEGQQVVQLLEIGDPEGISLEDAAWHTENPQVGDVVTRPVEGVVHTLAWRWLSEAFPGLAEQVVSK